MVPNHERLDVYHLALDFLVLVNGIAEVLPRGRSRIADQLTRASLSLVVNVAEGAGKHTKQDRRRHYLNARSAATELAALLDVCLRLKLLDEPRHKSGKGLLARIMSMLTKLARSADVKGLDS